MLSLLISFNTNHADKATPVPSPQARLLYKKSTRTAPLTPDFSWFNLPHLLINSDSTINGSRCTDLFRSGLREEDRPKWFAIALRGYGDDEVVRPTRQGTGDPGTVGYPHQEYPCVQRKDQVSRLVTTKKNSWNQCGPLSLSLSLSLSCLPPPKAPKSTKHTHHHIIIPPHHVHTCKTSSHQKVDVVDEEARLTFKPPKTYEQSRELQSIA